jgi:hypothetical protein
MLDFILYLVVHNYGGHGDFEGITLLQRNLEK